MTLNEYLAYLGWSLSDLCAKADISMNTARRAVQQNITSARSAQKIAQALSQATGKQVFPGDIIGLLVQG